MSPIVTIEQEFTGHYFIEQAAERPDIWSFGGAYFLSSVIIVWLLFILDGQSEHFGRFDALSASWLEIELILFVAVDFGHPEISKNNINFGWLPQVVGEVEFEQDVVSFDVIMSHILLMQ